MVPSGCLALLALFVAVVGSIVLLVFGVLKSSEIYKDALARARAEPAVVQTLGTPIKDGFFFSGNIHSEGTTGDADLAIPISGPKKRGTLYVVAKRSAGAWNYSVLAVEVTATKQRIDLLHE